VGAALSLAILVPSIIVHEVAHGLMAYACGDDTAKRAGRLTANPVKHVSLWGTFILPFFFVVVLGTGFGFAKPVPVDLERTRKPRHASLLISFAGPASNLIIVAMAYAIAQIADVPGQVIDHGYVFTDQIPVWMQGLFLVGLLNLWLAIFNLLPIPPLDGSAIIERLLPARALKGYHFFRSFALPLVFIVIYFAPGPISWLSNHVEVFWRNQFFY
jgi:Zn-dependent protease